MKGRRPAAADPLATTTPRARRRTADVGKPKVWAIRVPRRHVEQAEPTTHGALNETWRSLSGRVLQKGPRRGSPEFDVWMGASDFLKTLPAQLDAVSWNWFVTLTCAPARAVDLDRAVQQWADRIAADHSKHVLVTYGVEDAGSGRHAHALVAILGAEPEPCRSAERHWKAGHSQVRKFVPSAGGEAYVTKDGNWGTTVGCTRRPACRRSKCLWADKRLTRPDK